MKIKHLKQAILLCRDAGVTPFIWGHRGLGKSQVTDQTATEGRMGFSDMRLSQCEASDLRGLPLADKDKSRTIFLPPSDLPLGGTSWEEYQHELGLFDALKECLDEKDLMALVKDDAKIVENASEVIKILQDKRQFREADKIARKRAEMMPLLDEGILFLDELNRAQDDVIQAVFQLVLERRLGTYVLPSGWHVVTAGNYMEGYMTNGFTDAAFLDRFTHLIFDSGENTMEEWVDYMSGRYGGAASGIIEFATQNVKHLDGDIKAELGFSIQPSRRSWEAVIRVEEAFRSGEFSDDARLSVIAGLVGQEAAMAYDNYSCPVRPRDLIDRGVKAHETALRSLTRAQKTGLCWGLVSFLKGKVDDDKKAKVALDFARFMATEGRDRDIAVAFCNLMVGGSNLKARAAMVSNPAVTKLIAKFRDKKNRKTFVDRLVEDPVLQKILSKTAWGEKQ